MSGLKEVRVSGSREVWMLWVQAPVPEINYVIEDGGSIGVRFQGPVAVPVAVPLSVASRR